MYGLLLEKIATIDIQIMANSRNKRWRLVDNGQNQKNQVNVRKQVMTS